MDGFLGEFVRTGDVGYMVHSGLYAAYYGALGAGLDVSAGSWTNRFFEKIILLGDPALDINPD